MSPVDHRSCQMSPLPLKNSRPFIIPIFITHRGCPHRCVFCDQKGITGTSDVAAAIDAADVRKEIVARLAPPRRRPDQEVQVAFYGGSFTGLALEEQAALLGAVAPFLEQGLVHGVRISTRPDYIGEETGVFLRRFGVRMVELGVQSLDEKVLQATQRGYTGDHVVRAFTLLKQAGLQTGGQLMIGLPEESVTGLVASAEGLARLAPDTVRLYPTLVLEGSGLAARYRAGIYRPLSLLQAVGRTVRVKRIFDARGIKVIRMGLQACASLEHALIAGPYHPAFGELVQARQMFLDLRALLAGAPTGHRLRVWISDKDQSIFRGLGNCSMKRLAGLGLLARLELLTDTTQPRYTLRCEK